MNDAMYHFIEENERKHWWFRARTEILHHVLLDYHTKYENVLDIGCGSGLFLQSIEDISTNRIGIDMHAYQTKTYSVKIGDACDLPLSDNSFELVTMLDVLEHIPESDQALQEVRRVLKKSGGGLFLLTVPAFQALYSPHDARNQHVCRYRKSELLKKLDNNGFDVLRSTYFNTILFPLEALVRLMEKAIGKEIFVSDTSKALDIHFNRFLYQIFHQETKFLKKHNFPFGLSLLAVAVVQP